jgi:hypothetical protein
MTSCAKNGDKLADARVDAGSWRLLVCRTASQRARSCVLMENQMNESVINRHGPLLEFRIVEHDPDDPELYSVDLTSGVKELVFDEITDMIIDHLTKDKLSTRSLRIVGKLVINADAGYVTGIWAMQISPTSPPSSLSKWTGQSAIKIDLGSEQIAEKSPIINGQSQSKMTITRATNRLVRGIQDAIFYRHIEILTQHGI